MSEKTLHGEQMIPQVLQQHPGLRPIFDHYGLGGCGGPLGPPETIAFFCRAHGVDEAVFLSELNAAVKNPPPAPAGAASVEKHPIELAAEGLYRRFFIAGLFFGLTGGVMYGLHLLAKGLTTKSWTAGFTVLHSNAHGHAMVLGWVSFFIMGFAYQTFPRQRHVRLARPEWALASFWLALFAVIAQVAAGALSDVWAGAGDLAFAGSLAEIAVAVLFLSVLIATIRLARKPLDVFDGYILAAAAMFVLQAAYSAWLSARLFDAPSRELRFTLVAQYQFTLRSLQLHGFALLMILGVALRMAPTLFGLKPVSAAWMRRALPLLVLGVLAEAFGYLAYRVSHVPAWRSVSATGIVLVAIVGIGLTLFWGILAKPIERDRGVKFVRAGVIWLHLALLFLCLVPIYNLVVLPRAGVLSESGSHALQIGFSHAYYGATRQALAVGFIVSFLIAFASKVAPNLRGVDVSGATRLNGVFALLMIGCALHVFGQAGTDFTDRAFTAALAGGALEFFALLLWSVHMGKVLLGKVPLPESLAVTAAASATSPASAAVGHGRPDQDSLQNASSRDAKPERAATEVQREIGPAERWSRDAKPERAATEVQREIGPAERWSRDAKPEQSATEVRGDIEEPRPSRILPEHKVGLVIEWFPATLQVFLARGLRPMQNPELRRTLGRTIDVGTAAHHHHMDLEDFLAELNRAAGTSEPES